MYAGISQGARHPQTEAIGEALDSLVRLAQGYKACMETRVAEEAASSSRIPAVRVEHDRHIFGLFQRADWLRLLSGAGFLPRVLQDPWGGEVFVALKPEN
jgi:hypothetical protein